MKPSRMCWPLSIGAQLVEPDPASGHGSGGAVQSVSTVVREAGDCDVHRLVGVGLGGSWPSVISQPSPCLLRLRGRLPPAQCAETHFICVRIWAS
ncbi:hypothetical protein DPEC_G00100730 [Dallia pectoralis]|uniref:Uncharacterized protein n=1 Tax=Dallia pectoralis TaxID=75939 RepID=A0ACC2GXK0_DALPE|nr:hypothetical protein DPEC_G00100730 [Dallia pectoralis]